MQHNEKIVTSDEHSRLQTNEANEVEKAATVIQKHIRRDSIQRKYDIDHLEEDQLETYATYVLGNDPNMSYAMLKKYREPKDKIALIATSGMRSVYLACELGNKKNITKIILIDNSREVHAFWYAVRTLMKDEHKAATQALFFENFPKLLEANKRFYRDIHSNDTIMNYFNALFNKHKYDAVRAIIVHASLIKQSWADPLVFVKVKNILSYLRINKIYMYPSNIASCINDLAIQDQLFENIQKLDPVVCIHTGTGLISRHRPKNVYLLSRHDPAYVRHTLFPTQADNNSNVVNYSSIPKKLI